MKKNNNSIKFNLVEGEVVRKVQYTKDSMMVSRIATFSFLKVLDYEGLLPKGYLTRVKNGHISYHTSVLMCRKQSPHSAYRLASTKYGEYTLIGLVEKPTTASMKAIYGGEDEGWVDEPESTPQPEPTPEQLIKVIDLTEDDEVESTPASTPVCYAYNTNMECTDCNRDSAKGALCKYGMSQYQHGDEYQDDDADIPTNDENAMWANVVADMKSMGYIY